MNKLTSNEIHAFVIGFFEVLCPWPARSNELDEDYNPIPDEYHYYLAGRGLGLPVLLLLIIGITKFALDVLL
ncbi:hypothetical protein ES703_96306 [subsurface metagenome]